MSVKLKSLTLFSHFPKNPTSKFDGKNDLLFDHLVLKSKLKAVPLRIDKKYLAKTQT